MSKISDKTYPKDITAPNGAVYTVGKRKGGRPKGSTDSKPRKRRTNAKYAYDNVEKTGKLTAQFYQELEKLQTDIERVEFCLSEYRRFIELRRVTGGKLRSAMATMNRHRDKKEGSKSFLAIDIVPELLSEFNDIMEDVPLSKAEVISNLILNFIKAHKGFSKVDLMQIKEGTAALERTSYKNTKIAASMLVHAPYDAVKHEHAGPMFKPTIANPRPTNKEYAHRVDVPYEKDEVMKALEKGGVVDMSDLFD